MYTRIYIYICIYIYMVTPPTTRRPLQNTLNNQCETCFFRWSDFGSFSDAAFVSHSKIGKAKDPRIQNSKIPKLQTSQNPKIQKSKNPKTQNPKISNCKNPKIQNFSHLRNLAKKCGFLDFWSFFIIFYIF